MEELRVSRQKKTGSRDALLIGAYSINNRGIIGLLLLADYYHKKTVNETFGNSIYSVFGFLST